MVGRLGDLAAVGGVVEVAEGLVAEVGAAAAVSVGEDVVAGMGEFDFHEPPGNI
jgi:hypothetical protein